MDEITRLWGANLKRWRTALGHSQETVAHTLKVSQSTIARWENGLAEPRRVHKVSLAEFYGTDVAILFPLTRGAAA